MWGGFSTYPLLLPLAALHRKRPCVVRRSTAWPRRRSQGPRSGAQRPAA
jgi:hypothetical protein